MEVVTSIIVAAIVGLVGWIYNQSIKITRLEGTVETLSIKLTEVSSESDATKTAMYGIDARIDKRVNDATIEMTKFLHELQLTLKELNTTVKFLQAELKELKKK